MAKRSHTDHDQWRLRELGISVAILGAALVLPALISASICPIRHIFHIPCPFCGLTHGVAEALKGHWHQAFLAHFASIPFAAFFVLRAAYLLFTIASRTNGWSWKRELTVDKAFNRLFFLTVLVGYVSFFLMRR